MASLPMVASGGGGLHWDIVKFTASSTNDRITGALAASDVTNYTTLKIGKVYVDGGTIGGNKYYDIKPSIGGSHSSATYSFQVTNSEQTFDITNFTELEISVDCTLSTGWKTFFIEDVSVY